MTEWHFPSDVHTFEFHEHRERAPHLEQDDHRARLLKVRDLIVERYPPTWTCDGPGCGDGGCGETSPWHQISDLGCGDGGLLQLLEAENYDCWGYDFSPVNQPGWAERGVEGKVFDVFNNPKFDTYDDPVLGEVVVMTEVLEHLQDPHNVVRLLNQQRHHWGVKAVVASSPRFETGDAHGDCHQWAWDWEGYEKLFTDAGWEIKEHVAVDWSQIVVVE